MKIKYPAKYTVPWAGKFIDCCEGHANQFKAIAAAIESPFDVRFIDDKTECQNCVMESKEKK